MENSSRGFLDLGILSLTAIAFGVLFGLQSRPLEPSRPFGDNPGKPSDARAAQFAVAQCDDPLAFTRLRRLQPESEQDWATNCLNNDEITQLLSQPAAADTAKPWILPVETDDGIGPESIENRRRARYATLAALHAAGYAAEDADRLHLGIWQLPPWSESRGGMERDFGIAIEFFRHKAAIDMPARIAVIWIPSGNLFSGAEDSLASVIEGILTSEGESPEHASEAEAPGRLIAIAPVDSAGLRSLLWPEDGEVGPSDQWVLYNTAATVTAATLAGEWRRNLPAQLPRMEHFVSNDDDRMRDLATELLRRGIFQDLVTVNGALDVGRRRSPLLSTAHRVLLVAELNTGYGRLLPETFNKQLDIVLAKHLGICQQNLPKPLVKTYGYYRGIDRVQPAPQTTGNRSTAQQAGIAAPFGGFNPEDPRALIQRSQGLNQFDYIRRIVQDARGTLEDDGGQIVAVGVLGTDPYDKLLLLQALRGEFPHAVFFTTDLDARMLHPAELVWTRNLVLAASDGLSVTDLGVFQDITMNMSPAPMRDSYQVATFRAVYSAATGKVIPRVDDRDTTLFEIGRNGFVKLEPESAAFPAPNREKPSARASSVFVAGSLLAILILWAFRRPSQMARRSLKVLAATNYRRNPTWWNWTAPRLLPAIVCIGVIAVAASDNLEPDQITDGVSVWPFVMLHLLAASVGLSASIEILIKRRKVFEDAAVGFTSASALPSGRSQTARRMIARVLSGVTSPLPRLVLVRAGDAVGLSAEQRGQRRLAVHEFAAQLRWAISRRATAFAVAAIFLAMFVVFLTAVAVFPSPDTIRWARGDLARGFAEWSWFLAYLSLLALTAVCVDLARIVRHVIRVAQWLPECAVTPPDDLNEESLESHLESAILLRHRLIETVSEPCVRVFAWPLGILLIMVIGQSRVFDRFVFAPAGVIGLGLVAVVCLWSVATLQFAAGSARRTLLDELHNLEGSLTELPGTPQVDSRAAMLKWTREQIAQTQAIVFRPLWAGPLARSIMPALAALAIIAAQMYRGDR